MAQKQSAQSWLNFDHVAHRSDSAEETVRGLRAAFTFRPDRIASCNEHEKWFY
jgi:hypothetical protein